MSTPTERLPILDEVGAELNSLFEAQERRQPRWRWGSRRWMRARVLLPLATVLVAGSAAAATITLSGGAKPLKAGRVIECPPSDDYTASRTSGLVFPSNYPTYKGTGLTSWSVVRCFSSLQNAIDGGYKVAPVPRGYVQIAGVYLTRSTAYVRATCRRAQRVVHAPVFCPQVLPAPWGDESDPRNESIGANCPSKACGAPLLSINGAFAAPERYTVDDSNLGSAAIWAISTEQESDPATVGVAGCLVSRLRSRTTFRGHPAGWYTCTDVDRVAANTYFQWTVGDEHYGIELGGDSAAAKQLIRYVAAHMVELKPKT